MNTFYRCMLADALGTLLLLLTVVIGSGIMAERLCADIVGLALLANTLPTVGELYILIEVFGPVSGAHFNPAVTLVIALRGALPRSHVLPYIGAQLMGAMFDASILQRPSKIRGGTGQGIADAVALHALLGQHEGSQ